MKTGYSRKGHGASPSPTDNVSTTGSDSSMSAPTSSDNDVSVGVLDPQQSSRRRQMLALINKMRGTG